MTGADRSLGPTGPDDDARLGEHVELLERALAYTRGVLTGVDDTDPGVLAMPTPCSGWRVRDLLDHMADGLAAFTEASAGRVRLRPVPAGPMGGRAGGRAAGRAAGRADGRVAVLQQHACALLGAWAGTVLTSGAPIVPSGPSAGPRTVRVGDATLEPARLLTTAALEITVHGWDLAVATGQDASVPAPLASALLPAAPGLVAPEDRGGRFGVPQPVATGDPAARLLAFLGRDPDGGRTAHRWGT